ncbi:S1/P1 nuclease [Thalassotalea euphylliae]|uniref:Endonuclease n=1 Tax=Thalassotalea euphylliae TaxID=1655234 RepID=A0A3E0UK37_9GAMM|nr:S1/P1 nuclease [Thalassotalea euphylliae]REL36934.1 hypothetical protein DXX92_17340 [Thalassotalea euphylliae]
MTAKTIVYLASAAILLIGSAFQPAYALGKLGHQLVCDLAYQALTPDAKSQVDNLLASLNKTERKRINQYNFAKKNSPITLGKACTWPDAIKKLDHYDKYKPWHYVNLGRDEQELTHSTCQKDCITQAIPYHAKQVTQGKNVKQRTEALMFLGHWLGDIHQPLHVSFASDWGGNKTKIEVQGVKCSSMHWLWDECLLTRQTKHKKLAEQYQQMFSLLAKQLASTPSADMVKWQNASVLDWANESFAIARLPATKYCQSNASHTCQERNLPVKLTSKELDLMSQQINLRMLMASVRLAHQLNTSFN